MKNQHGFSILELFISMAIGLVVLAGVLSVFLGMRTTSSETSSYGEMQETGRFTISMLTDDLMRQGFWGNMIMPLSRSALLGIPAAAPAGECTGGGINNGSFPSALGNFRSLWGVTATNATAMGCINDAKIGSDILQVKRVHTVSSAVLDANNYYLITNKSAGQIIDGGDPLPVIDNSNAWEYKHNVYYVSEESMGSDVVPVLNIIQLVNTMDNEPLIDGVEMLKFMYGVDTSQDGIVDAYMSANNMTQAFWDNEANSRILSVRMYVLVRDIKADDDYVNDIVYQLGDTTFTAPSDNYRRMLFSSTVTLFNGVKIW